MAAIIQIGARSSGDQINAHPAPIRLKRYREGVEMAAAARRAMRKVCRRTPCTSSAFFERNPADAGRSAPADRLSLIPSQILPNMGFRKGPSPFLL